MKILGIDFGTVWTKACIFDSATPNTYQLVELESDSSEKTDFELQGGKTACPTAVFYENGLQDKSNVKVGKEATRSRLLAPENFYNMFKPHLSKEDGEKWTELVIDVLKYVHIKAKEQAGVNSFDKTVITVPSATIEGDQRWNIMMKAAHNAGFSNIEIIREPEAAAYHILSELNDSILGDKKKFLVYDFGGGTFDPALLEIKNKTLRVIGEWNSEGAGKDIGGIYIDDIIRQDIVDNVDLFREEVYEFLASIETDEFGMPVIDSSDRSFIRQYRTAMLYKDQLSQLPVAAKHFICKGNDKYEKRELSYEYALSREKFDEMTAPIIADTIQCCDSFLAVNDYSWKDIGFVFCVGGSCMIPSVKSSLEFQKQMEECDFEIIQADDNSKIDVLHAVAIGASKYPMLKPTNEQRIEFGKEAVRKGDFTEADYQFEKAESKYWQGIMYYQGLGRKRSFAEALKYFRESKMDEDCRTMLALMHFKSEGVRQDIDKAKNVFPINATNKSTLWEKLNKILITEKYDASDLEYIYNYKPIDIQPPILDPELKKTVHKWVDKVVDYAKKNPVKASIFALLATGILSSNAKK